MTIPIPADIAARNALLIDPTRRAPEQGYTGSDVRRMAPRGFVSHFAVAANAGGAPVIFVAPSRTAVIEIRRVLVTNANAAAVTALAQLARLADAKAAVGGTLDSYPLTDVTTGRALRAQLAANRVFWAPILSSRIYGGTSAALITQSQNYLANPQILVNEVFKLDLEDGPAVWLDGRDAEQGADAALCLAVSLQAVNLALRVTVIGYEWSHRGGAPSE